MGGGIGWPAGPAVTAVSLGRFGRWRLSTILITGAAGGIGTMLRARLARPGRTLRLFDIAPLDAGPGEEAVCASVTDLGAVTQACRGIDAVIHLGARSTEGRWEQVLESNIDGTYKVYEAVRRNGVPRVVFASSNHAVGFHPPAHYPLSEETVTLPDTYYGVSKVAGEALGALYHHRYGIDVINVRILTCAPKPRSVRALSTWLSPDDCGRLFEACLTAEKPGHRIVYGVSANTRGGWVSLEGAAALGYTPEDDAEIFADELLAEHGRPTADDPLLAHLGGEYTTPRFDADRLWPLDGYDRETDR
jgi:NAD(P)-dependent dehydrogenase (short-subunit alcohol dehydrogenase family)